MSAPMIAFLRPEMRCHLVQLQKRESVRTLVEDLWSRKVEVSGAMGQSTARVQYQEVMKCLMEYFEIGFYDALGIHHLLTPVRATSAKVRMKQMGKKDMCTQVVKGAFVHQVLHNYWLEQCEVYVYPGVLEIAPAQEEVVRAFLKKSGEKKHPEAGSYAYVWCTGSAEMIQITQEALRQKYQLFDIQMYSRREQDAQGWEERSYANKGALLWETLDVSEQEGFHLAGNVEPLKGQSAFCIELFNSQWEGLGLNAKDLNAYQSTYSAKAYKELVHGHLELFVLYYESFADTPLMLKGERKELLGKIKKNMLPDLKQKLGVLLGTPVSAKSAPLWYEAGVQYGEKMFKEVF